MKTDEEIIKDILAGNEESFSFLIDKYYPKLMTFCMKLFITREDAEDIIQEVFIKVYKSLYKYNSNWAFNTWIYKIAVNTLKDIRKRKVIKATELNIEIFTENNDFQDGCIDSIQNKELVRSILASMDQDLKTMMILRYYQEFSFKEIGLIFNMSADAVKMKIFRARERLCKDYSIKYYGGGINEMHI
ncbi:RNA polymerase sigma factor [Acetivibrio cellulolyticus]|uniref:RNA polymerase sigma factor n=1 Tax=Acetivibrio cellulolyticus TaxID=35830 RepID=UPI0001E2F0D7|nr:RNA polymerase sigma factor [Acetivibrio cellulolyticus]